MTGAFYIMIIARVDYDGLRDGVSCVSEQASKRRQAGASASASAVVGRELWMGVDGKCGGDGALGFGL
jgi:hypothetical protein